MTPAERSACVSALADDAASLLAQAHVLAAHPDGVPLPPFVLSSLERISRDCDLLAADVRRNLHPPDKEPRPCPNE